MIKFWAKYPQKLHDLHYFYKEKSSITKLGKYRINKGLFVAFKAECKRRDVTMTDIIIKAILSFLNENHGIKFRRNQRN